MDNSSQSQNTAAQIPIHPTQVEQMPQQQKRKLPITIIFIILIIIAAGTAIYLLFFKPKTKPATDTKLPTKQVVAPTPFLPNWKIYQDSHFSFQFSYPATWAIQDQAGFTAQNEYGKDEKSIVFYDPNPKNEDEYISVTVNFSKKGYKDVVPENTFNSSVGGINSYRYISSLNMPLRSASEAFKKGDVFYEIILHYGVKNASALNMFDQILSTVKFTSQDTFQKAKGFPVYPEAVYVGEEKNPPCQPGWDKDITGCDGTTYTWKTPDDYDKVRSFYKSVNSDGWTCSAGGAGSYTSLRQASGISDCTLNGTSYKVNYDANATETTISVIIPN